MTQKIYDVDDPGQRPEEDEKDPDKAEIPEYDEPEEERDEHPEWEY